MYYYIDGIETERMRTRFITMDDARLWESFLRDPETSRFMSFIEGPTPADRAETWMRFTLKRYEEQRYGLQALVDKDTNELIGQCGLILQQIDGHNEIEVGYHLLRQHWGKGYATEAARAFRDFAFERTATASVISIIDPLNEPSKRVAARNGMTLWSARHSWSKGIYDIFRISREDWEDRV